MNIHAHRTAMRNTPPNSLEGFQFCFENNVEVVECDVVFVGDEAYIQPDSEALPCTRCNPLTVDNVLDFIRMRTEKNIRIMFDIKFYGGTTLGPIDVGDMTGHFSKVPETIIQKVYDLIIWPAGQIGISDRIGFVTFLGGMELLKSVKRSAPEVFTELIVIFPWTTIKPIAQHLDAITIGWKNMNHWKLFPSSMEKIIEDAAMLNLQVNCGLANSNKEMQWALKKNFNGMWTDDVIKAKSFAEGGN